MPEDAGPATCLAIVAGRGGLPRDIAVRRAAHDLPYLLIIFPDCWEEWMADHPHERHLFEKVGALFAALKQANVTHIVFAGAMNRPKIRPWRADLKALGVIGRAVRLLGRGDDEMLRGFAAIFEEQGVSVIGPKDILGAGMSVPPGVLGRHAPSSRDKADAARAGRIVSALGALDIGQGAVVADGVCLAVEAIEGTDLMLARLADLPAERRASCPPPSGVLYKGPKPDQDRRLDMPAIGPRTVAGAVAAGLSGIVVAGGETTLLEAAETRSAADAAGIFIYGATAAELAEWES